MTHEIYSTKTGKTYAEAINGVIAGYIAQKLREEFRDDDFLYRTKSS